ncbi:MAG TPA: DUF4097 family beta strand repeat-containing protein [Opitutaceae bacterium]|nr:DUF4097 family beta strand repeat-containing protein [Opitutaceae bacterium]
MNHRPLSSSFLLAATLTLVLLTAARADQTTSEIKFTDSTKPGTLKVSLSRGDLRIRGIDGDAITVRSEAKAVTAAPRKDGLRVLTASSSFNLSEKENVVTLDAMSEGWGKGGSSSDFEVSVPRTTSVIISNSWGGDISCTNVAGDIEIKSMNGEIKLDGVASAVLVETMNGEITANVREIREGKPLSFTSMNGEIVIRVPQESKANVRLRSQNGSILTDFDEKVLVTKTESFGVTRGRRSNGRLTTAKIQNRSDSEFGQEIHAVVKEAVQIGLEAAREATNAAREAVNEAREAVNESAMEAGTTVTIPPRPPLPPMTGGKIVSGTLNGGGPDIQVATMNGDVILRKISEGKDARGK